VVVPTVPTTTTTGRELVDPSARVSRSVCSDLLRLGELPEIETAYIAIHLRICEMSQHDVTWKNMLRIEDVLSAPLLEL
jgi:uncharacterized hydantoinase/oxoprolinase family protein